MISIWLQLFTTCFSVLLLLAKHFFLPIGALFQKRTDLYYFILFEIARYRDERKLLCLHAALKWIKNRSLKFDWFFYLHTKQSEHLDHNIWLFIKNKSGKRKLSLGGGLTSNTPSDQTVWWWLVAFDIVCKFSKFDFYLSQLIMLLIAYSKNWKKCDLHNKRLKWLYRVATFLNYTFFVEFRVLCCSQKKLQWEQNLPKSSNTMS